MEVIRMISEKKIKSLVNQLGENADAETQFALAHCLNDKKEAVKLYQKSANQGNTDALFELGICYLNGDGVHYNEKTGLNLLQKAADLGEVEALLFMGDYYIGPDLSVVDIEDSKEDIKKGINYYQQAAEKGDPIAQEKLRTAFDVINAFYKNKQTYF